MKQPIGPVLAGFLAGALVSAGAMAVLRRPSLVTEAPRQELRAAHGAAQSAPVAPSVCAPGGPRLASFPRSPGGTPEVDAAWLAEHRCQVKIIDVREPEEIRREGRIQGAEEVPLTQVQDAAARWSPEEPVVLVCRSGRRSFQAQELLLSLGFRHAASLTGGMIEWERAGFPIEATPPGSASSAPVAAPSTAPSGASPAGVSRGDARAQLLATLQRPGAVIWSTAARLFSAGEASCVDGRGEAPIIGTPGGDVGDLLLSLAALEAQAGHPIRADHLDALLARYVASFGRFYLHTDGHALERLAAALRRLPAFREVQVSWTSPEEIRRFVLAPPPGLEDALLDELARPEHIGCGHLRLLSEHPEAYGLRPGLSAATLKAIFRHAFRHPDALDFVLLEGEHREQGVLLVRSSGPVEAHSRVPMLTPHEGLSEYFVFHPEVATYIRQETADFLAEQHERLGLATPDRGALRKKVEQLGQRQLAETLKRLAPTLPRIEVRLDEEKPSLVQLK